MPVVFDLVRDSCNFEGVAVVVSQLACVWLCGCVRGCVLGCVHVCAERERERGRERERRRKRKKDVEKGQAKRREGGCAHESEGESENERNSVS